MKLLVMLAIGVRVASAQRPAAPIASAAVAAWREGLEVRVNGSGWARALTVPLTRAQCPPSDSPPCAAGSAVGVDVRFPSIPSAVDLSKVRAQIGEPAGTTGARYEVRVVRGHSSSRCPAGFMTSAPDRAERLAIDLGPAGPPLPITCRWTAIVGVPSADDPSHLTVIWSDTVVVQLVKR